MENNVNGLFHQQENNMFDMRKTGARISQLRRAAGLTQAEPAEKPASFLPQDQLSALLSRIMGEEKMLKLLPPDFCLSRLLLRDFCPYPDFEDKICLPSNCECAIISRKRRDRHGRTAVGSGYPQK